MIRTRRLAVLAPLVVSSLALAPVAAAHAASGPAHSPAAVPAKARCLLTQDAANSKPGDPKFTLLASGLKSDGVSFSGGNGGGFSKVTDGAISFSGLNPGTYTITGDKDGTVKCGKTPGAKTTDNGEKQDAKKQFKKGFSDGFAAVKKACDAKLPQGLTAVDPNYESGFKAGAALAATTFCGETD
ncbi:hypothetical protein AB0C59_01610 [Streptomyces sp. NPDC048664]|uniref:hypothetical protein n=1 Tax=Streptomyces sp. NPDC048664 TaxID=3154505 RepID=UPI00343D894E